MVENTGKTLRADTYKPVNLPEPVRVEEDPAGFPAAVRFVPHSSTTGKARRQAVSGIEDRWRLDDEWWRPDPVSRMYYALMLASGDKMMLYQDLVTGKWYRQGE